MFSSISLPLTWRRAPEWIPRTNTPASEYVVSAARICPNPGLAKTQWLSPKGVGEPNTSFAHAACPSLPSGWPSSGCDRYPGCRPRKRRRHDLPHAPTTGALPTKGRVLRVGLTSKPLGSPCSRVCPIAEAITTCWQNTLLTQEPTTKPHAKNSDLDPDMCVNSVGQHSGLQSCAAKMSTFFDACMAETRAKKC